MEFLLVLVVVGVAAAVPVVDHDFATFKAQFNKTYKSLQHEEYHRQIFLKAKWFINQHNADSSYSYKLGINEFTDIDPVIFAKQRNGHSRRKSTLNESYTHIFRATTDGTFLPSFVDWRDKGVVTGVKDQGECGSCWAFSATGSLEGQHALKTGNLVSLSEQELVDCIPSDDCDDGGDQSDAFKYIKKHGGIDTERDYPYKATDGTCRPGSEDTVGATCRGYHRISKRNCHALKEALATIGPISVSMDAGGKKFQHYKSGIYHPRKCSSSEDDLDHSVLAVGYGEEDGVEYWLIKNSWGTNWGLDGYFKIAAEANLCGICTEALYPLV